MDVISIITMVFGINFPTLLFNQNYFYLQFRDNLLHDQNFHVWMALSRCLQIVPVTYSAATQFHHC